jgi:hypothetical protein
MPDAVKQVYYFGDGRSRVLKHLGFNGSIRLIGAMEDTSAIADLRQLLNASRSVPRSAKVEPKEQVSMDTSTGEIQWHASPITGEVWALQVLFKLHDSEATAEVLACLSADGVASRTLGIGCVQYAERKDYVPFLLPLLDDAREAARFGPVADFPASEQFHCKLRDLAANAISGLLAIDQKRFKTIRSRIFNDDELAKLKTLAEEALKADK